MTGPRQATPLTPTCTLTGPRQATLSDPSCTLTGPRQATLSNPSCTLTGPRQATPLTPTCTLTGQSVNKCLLCLPVPVGLQQTCEVLANKVKILTVCIVLLLSCFLVFNVLSVFHLFLFLILFPVTLLSYWEISPSLLAYALAIFILVSTLSFCLFSCYLDISNCFVVFNHVFHQTLDVIIVLAMTVLQLKVW